MHTPTLHPHIHKPTCLIPLAAIAQHLKYFCHHRLCWYRLALGTCCLRLVWTLPQGVWEGLIWSRSEVKNLPAPGGSCASFIFNKEKGLENIRSGAPWTQIICGLKFVHWLGDHVCSHGGWVMHPRHLPAL